MTERLDKQIRDKNGTKEGKKKQSAEGAWSAQKSTHKLAHLNRFKGRGHLSSFRQAYRNPTNFPSARSLTKLP